MTPLGMNQVRMCGNCYQFSRQSPSANCGFCLLLGKDTSVLYGTQCARHAFVEDGQPPKQQYEAMGQAKRAGLPTERPLWESHRPKQGIKVDRRNISHLKHV